MHLGICTQRLGGSDISPPAPSTIGQGTSQGLLTPLLFQTAPESHVTALELHWEEQERHGEAEEGSVGLYLVKLIAAATGRIKGFCWELEFILLAFVVMFFILFLNKKIKRLLFENIRTY